MLEKTLAIILAGGMGSRLHPLTEDRAKPAVPFGGKYRIIDFVLTNCLRSGIRRVLVLTQYKSHSLQKHVRDGWSIFNPELGEYITLVPPQMRTGERWYAGTADAIYQNLYLLQRSGAEHIMILPGDHIYRMDYAPMMAFYQQNDADLTVACMDVALEEGKQFGIMALDDNMCIESFVEKPANPAPMPGSNDRALASMGIYIFSTNRLLDVLTEDHADENSSHDFGKDIIPKMIHSSKVFGYRFGGETGRVTPDNYWRDVGTIDAYYKANMDLLDQVPPMNLYQVEWPIRTYSGQYPPARTVSGDGGSEGLAINSIVSSGTVISGASAQRSILFNNVYVGDESHVYESLLFEGVKVGRGVHLNKCIIDKGVEIPDGEVIGFDVNVDMKRFDVSAGGVVVIPKGYQF
ncbi:MAG: glucose-1-phosphate adenylyltransferase [Gammaproteobacteria bacterium]|nr:glucose-1-phosphate adenylyltransferase [Gammaproteobacteria bacterium]